MVNYAVSVMCTMVLVKFMFNDVPHAALDIGKGNPNPNPTKRRELVDFYGSWAVGKAESVCPRGDYECVEREASRLAAIVRQRHDRRTEIQHADLIAMREASRY